MIHVQYTIRVGVLPDGVVCGCASDFKRTAAQTGVEIGLVAYIHAVAVTLVIEPFRLWILLYAQQVDTG